MTSTIRYTSYLLTLALALLFLHAPCFAQKAEYPLVQWTDLMPPEDLEALLNPPAWLDEVEEGSAEDKISKQVSRAISDAKDDRYQQALVSTRVRPEFDKRNMKIPGFVVPLAFDDNMVISEFFLVPFFGACIHVPPPPPNQMIYIAYAKGLALENLYDPFVVEGTLHVKSFEGGDMGTSAYSMQVAKIYPYTE